MTRSQALRAYREARESGDTRRMHHAEADLRKATHAILSNPPRKAKRSLWRRVWDRLVETTP